MLQLRIGNIFTDVCGEIPEDKFKVLRRKMSFRPEGYQFNPMYRRTVRDAQGRVVRRIWDGWKRQIWKNTKRTYFPTGLFSIADDFLSNEGIPYQVVDLREKPDPNVDLGLLDDELEDREYQNHIADTACEVGRGIIQAPTGSGKTTISAKIISQLKVAPFLFFTTSKDLLSQARRDLTKLLSQDGEDIHVGQIGAGKVDISDVNVMTIQTAVRALGKKWDKSYKFDREDKDDKTPIESYKKDIIDLLHSAKGVICDEVQHWRADTCQLVARAVENAYYTFGCSATPYRDSGDDMLIQACFGRKLVTISASELIPDYLMQPNIWMVKIEPPASKYRQYPSIYKDQVVESKFYNSRVAGISNSFIEAGRLVLVLVQHIPHGELLNDLIPGSEFINGNDSKTRRENMIDNLRNRDVSCIISTSLFDEGIDVRPLDTVVLAGQGKSRVRAMQRIGRILRKFPGKESATAVDFVIWEKYLREHAVEREKMYSTEPKFIIRDIDPVAA